MNVLKRGIAGLLLLGAVLGRSAWAMAEPPSVEDLFATLKNANPGLQDYQSDIGIALKVKAGFTIPLDLHGKYYYKRPDHYRLKLEHAPQFVQKYPQIFGWNLPKLENFNSRIMGEEAVDGRECYHVMLTPKHEMADLIGQELWIDKQDAVFPRQIVHYKDNGEIDINVQYMTKDTFHLFNHMTATFTFPKAHVSATADATYNNYQVNTNLPDSIFQAEK